METVTKSVKKEKTADEIRINNNNIAYRYRAKHDEAFKIYQAAYQRANYWKYRGVKQQKDSFLQEQKRMFGILLSSETHLKISAK